MFEMVIEAVLVSLCVGGVLGSVITMHLQAGSKKQEVRQEPKQETLHEVRVEQHRNMK